MVAGLHHRSVNSDLFNWAYSSAMAGSHRVYDPSFALAKDPDIPSKMRRDPIIDHALRLRQQQVAGRLWDIEPGGPSDADKRLASIVKDALEHVHRFDNTRFRLAEACFRGASYEVVEGDFITATLGDDTQARRWWVPQQTKHVDRRMLRQVNKSTRVEVAQHSAISPGTGVPTNTALGIAGTEIAWEMWSTSQRTWYELDDAKQRALIRHIYDQKMENLQYGGGLIEPLYWYFFAKGIALQEGLNGLETWARGWITAKIDGIRKGDTDKTNDERVNNAITKLENMRSRHVLVHGEDTELNIVEKGGTGSKIVTDYLSYLDSGMTRLILGSLRPTGGGGDSATGARAQASVEADTSEAQTQYDQGMMEETISTDFVGLFLHVNRAAIREAGLHTLKPSRFITVREKLDEPEKAIAITSQALAAGIDLKREEVYAKIGYTIPEKGDELIKGQVQQEPGMFDTLGLGQPSGDSRGAPGQEEEPGTSEKVVAGGEPIAAEGIEPPTVQEISLSLERAIKNGDRLTANITRKKLWAAMGEDAEAPDISDVEWKEMKGAGEKPPGAAPPFGGKPDGPPKPAAPPPAPAPQPMAKRLPVAVYKRVERDEKTGRILRSVEEPIYPPPEGEPTAIVKTIERGEDGRIAGVTEESVPFAPKFDQKRKPKGDKGGGQFEPADGGSSDPVEDKPKKRTDWTDLSEGRAKTWPKDGVSGKPYPYGNMVAMFLDAAPNAVTVYRPDSGAIQDLHDKSQELSAGGVSAWLGWVRHPAGYTVNEMKGDPLDLVTGPPKGA